MSATHFIGLVGGFGDTLKASSGFPFTGWVTDGGVMLQEVHMWEDIELVVLELHIMTRL